MWIKGDIMSRSELTAENVIKRYKELGVTPCQGMLNVRSVDGIFEAGVDNRCCAMGVMLIGRADRPIDFYALIVRDLFGVHYPSFTAGFDRELRDPPNLISEDRELGAGIRDAVEAEFGSLE